MEAKKSKKVLVDPESKKYDQIGEKNLPGESVSLVSHGRN